MSNVRTVMLVTGEVVIGDQTNVSDTGDLTLRYPVTLHQIADENGQPRLAFAPFFPMAKYDEKSVTIPERLIGFNYPAQDGIVQGHDQHVISKSGLVVANTVPSFGDSNEVSPDEMKSRSLRLASD